MNDRNQENLKKLFEQFMDPEQAQKHIEDIEKGEQLLREHPAPEPDDMLLANIKAEIALHILPRRAAVYKRIAYRAAAVAAAIIVIVAIGTSFLEKPDDMGSKPGKIYASVFPWDHHDSAVYNTRLEQIESDLQTLELGDEDTDNDSTVTELELESIEIAGDF